MGLAPRFTRHETVYLATSAAVGQLEGYTVTTVRQRAPGVWLYKVQFVAKPPAQATVGDRIDLRRVNRTNKSTPGIRFPADPIVFYNEEELLPLCEALTLVVDNLDKRLTRIQPIKNGCKPVPFTTDGSPRFNIDDTIWFAASARAGFLETAKVKAINTLPAGTATNRLRFVYELSTKSHLYFMEDELIDQCEAVDLVISSLNNQLAGMQQKLATQCKQ